MKKTTGFTLTELLIVVAIASILSIIAVPSYRSFVLKSHRADARSTLLDIAGRQERFIAQRNRYTIDLITNTELNTGMWRNTTSGLIFKSSRQLDYSYTVTPGPTGNILTSYLITATARDAQIKDTRCRTFTYNSNGTKTALHSNGTTITTNECW